MNEKTAARGRIRKSPLREAAAAMSAEAAAVEAAPEVAVKTDSRPALRPTMREEDPRTRAERRAAEVRGNVGNMDEGTDKYRIDDRIVPDGWSYEWKRKSILGQEDPSYQVQLERMGWEPVPASRHPSYMPDGNKYATIERDGMVLMERPMELTQEARMIELRKARQQVRHKEAQLNSAPGGDQFSRENKGNSLVKVSKSYEAIPIPSE